jgi:hypothetical protein
MGGSFSKMMDRIFGSREMRVLMLGLDAAGKTTILYKLRLNKDEVITTIPTVGFNVESVMFNRVKFNVWDVGGQDKIRPLWRHYYSGKLRPACSFGDGYIAGVGYMEEVLRGALHQLDMWNSRTDGRLMNNQEPKV